MIRSSIPAFWSAIGPEFAVKTTWPVVPEACGKRSESVSMPCWDSGPGDGEVVDQLAADGPGEPEHGHSDEEPDDERAELVPGHGVPETIQEGGHRYPQSARPGLLRTDISNSIGRG